MAKLKNFQKDFCTIFERFLLAKLVDLQYPFCCFEKSARGS
jgi:hypothetical protein